MTSPPRSRFTKLDETEVWRGSIVSVALGRFRAPDGHTFERELVHHPGAVSVVPVLDGGDRVLLVRQYRAAVDADLLEIPAGKRDVVGEPPEETARRELVEEVGRSAGRIEHLVTFLHSPGFCDEEQIVFVADDLAEAAVDAQGVEEQHMTVEEVALADVPGMISRGEIVDSKTIIALLMVGERRRS